MVIETKGGAAEAGGGDERRGGRPKWPTNSPGSRLRFQPKAGRLHHIEPGEKEAEEKMGYVGRTRAKMATHGG